MPFDMPREEPQYEEELEAKFRECMQSNVPARRGYDAAKSFGLDEESRLKAAVIQLTEMNRRASEILARYFGA